MCLIYNILLELSQVCFQILLIMIENICLEIIKYTYEKLFWIYFSHIKRHKYQKLFRYFNIRNLIHLINQFTISHDDILKICTLHSRIFLRPIHLFWNIYMLTFDSCNTTMTDFSRTGKKGLRFWRNSPKSCHHRKSEKKTNSIHMIRSDFDIETQTTLTPRRKPISSFSFRRKRLFKIFDCFSWVFKVLILIED